jgi:aromatic ring-cleaving dioxygenase
MTEKTAKSVNNLGYHAHIYYDPTSTRAVAEGVCAALGEHCQVEIDAFRDTPIGPHPIANVLVLFKPDQFEHVVPYLMLHRDGLDVLVHPLTEDAVEDHTDFALWLGTPVAAVLERSVLVLFLLRQSRPRLRRPHQPRAVVL